MHASELKSIFNNHVVTASNGNAKYKSSFKIRDNDGNLVFETSCYKGNVSISKKNLELLKNTLGYTK